MTAILDGVRVIEIGGYVTAPLATSILVQLGAEVLKVENPRGGDPFRKWSAAGSLSPTFTGINHAKASIAVDLQVEEGVEILLLLLRDADVLVENLRPGGLERLGLTDDVLAHTNPDLIRCSITGFGETGPDRDRPGYDTVGQAVSGLLGLLTDRDAPEAMGTSLSDHVTGVVAVIGVLAALYSRATTGTAVKVGTSLLEASMLLLSESFGRAIATGSDPDRHHRAALAQVHCLVAAGGQPLVIHLSSPEKFWAGLQRALDAPELGTDQRFATLAGRRRNHTELRAELQRRVGAMSRSECLARLVANDVPCGPLSSLSEVMDDPQVRELGMLVRSVPSGGPGPSGHVALPLRFDGRRPSSAGGPPRLGEQTRSSLARAGLSAEEIETLITRGVVADDAGV